MRFNFSWFSTIGQYIRHPRLLMSSKIALYIIAVLAVFFAYQTAQVVIKRHQTDNDIATFEKQVTDLKSQQGHLQELNQFLETDFFAEKEARLKLGMQKPGEQVVVIEDKKKAVDTTTDTTKPSSKVQSTTTVGDDSSDDVTVDDTTTPAKQKSNPKKWWDYFFAQQEK